MWTQTGKKCGNLAIFLPQSTLWSISWYFHSAVKIVLNTMCFFFLGDCKFCSANLHYWVMERRFGRMAWLQNVTILFWICSYTSHVVCLLFTSQQQIQQNPHSQIWMLPNLSYLLHDHPSHCGLYPPVPHLQGQFGLVLEWMDTSYMGVWITVGRIDFTSR